MRSGAANSDARGRIPRPGRKAAAARTCGTCGAPIHFMRGSGKVYACNVDELLIVAKDGGTLTPGYQLHRATCRDPLARGRERSPESARTSASPPRPAPPPWAPPAAVAPGTQLSLGRPRSAADNLVRATVVGIYRDNVATAIRAAVAHPQHELTLVFSTVGPGNERDEEQRRKQLELLDDIRTLRVPIGNVEVPVFAPIDSVEGEVLRGRVGRRGLLSTRICIRPEVARFFLSERQPGEDG